MVLLGWLHTHLVSQSAVYTVPDAPFEFEAFYKPFFSHADLFIHRNFFPEPWHVALLIDLRCKRDVYFGWRQNAVAAMGAFYLYGD